MQPFFCFKTRNRRRFVVLQWILARKKAKHSSSISKSLKKYAPQHPATRPCCYDPLPWPNSCAGNCNLLLLLGIGICGISAICFTVSERKWSCNRPQRSVRGGRCGHFAYGDLTDESSASFLGCGAFLGPGFWHVSLLRICVRTFCHARSLRVCCCCATERACFSACDFFFRLHPCCATLQRRSFSEHDCRRERPQIHHHWRWNGGMRAGKSLDNGQGARFDLCLTAEFVGRIAQLQHTNRKSGTDSILVAYALPIDLPNTK